MYSETFAAQWDRLTTALSADMEGRSAEALTAKWANEWYRTHAFRWSSIAENEGVLLSSEKKPELEAALLKEINAFSFQAAPLPQKPKPWLYLAVGAVLGTGIGLATGLKQLHVEWPLAINILLGLVTLGLSLVPYAKKLDNCAKTGSAAVRQAYLKQLTDRKPALVAVCQKYE